MTKIDAVSFSMIFGVLMCGAIIYAGWFKLRDRFIDQEPKRWRWYEWLALLVVGASFGSALFFGNLGSFLLPSERPFGPDTAHGYTHFIRAKYGSVYGTHFEYWGVTYGPYIAWSVTVASCALIVSLKINPKSGAFPLLIFVAAVIAMGSYYVYWRVFDPIR